MLRVLLTLHTLAAVIWVGGMFFMQVCLRPAAQQALEPPQRLPLLMGTLERFFIWVWVCVVTLLVSGFALIAGVGGFKHAPIYIHLMTGIGLVMMAIFAHIFFAPFKRFKRAVRAADWANAGASMARVRMLVIVNLVLGLVVVSVAVFRVGAV